METEKPKFRIDGQPFFDGQSLHPVGEEIVWDPPDEKEWDTKKRGKHHMHHYPPVTFVPLNEPAAKLKAELDAQIREQNKPVPTQDDEAKARLARMEEMLLQSINSMGALAAELRRQNDAKEQAAEAKAAKK